MRPPRCPGDIAVSASRRSDARAGVKEDTPLHFFGLRRCAHVKINIEGGLVIVGGDGVEW